MAVIDGFKGIRFQVGGTPADLSTRISPPYDVLEQVDKDRLLTADPANIVAVDLPFVPPKSAGPEHLYTQAGTTFRRWLGEGTLRRDPQPALYAIAQTFTLHGQPVTRRGFMARLKLEEFGKGQVFPHEQTFGGPKEDRFKLICATLANLSPVFGLYPDPRQEVMAALGQTFTRPPDVIATQDTVRNELWVVRDAEALYQVKTRMADKAVYIADGHHRYGTSLNYLAMLRGLSKTELPASHPGHYVLTFLVDMADSGLVVLPTHRLLEPDERLTTDSVRRATAADFEWLDVPDVTGAVGLTRKLTDLGPGHLGVFSGRSGQFGVLRLRNPERLRELEPTRSPAWAQLDLAALHRLALAEHITPQVLGGTEPKIRYIKDAADTIVQAQASGGLAFLVRPNTVDELRAVCSAGDLMPQKSTYFYPKIPTGLVMYDLAP